MPAAKTPVYKLLKHDICAAYREVSRDYKLNFLAWHDISKKLCELLNIPHTKENVLALQCRAYKIRKEVGHEKCPTTKKPRKTLAHRDGIKILNGFLNRDYRPVIENQEVYYMIPQADFIEMKSTMASMLKRKNYTSGNKGPREGMNIIITIPKTENWEQYRKEIDAAEEREDVVSFRVKSLPINAFIGSKCYVLHDGYIKGWMEITGFSNNKSFNCTTTGKKWSGNFIERSGKFHDLNIKYGRGFQGFRYTKMDHNLNGETLPAANT